MNITDFQSAGSATEWSAEAVQEQVGSDYVRAPQGDRNRRRKVTEAAGGPSAA